MNGLTVVIPSKTASNLIPCVEAVRKYEPWSVRVVVVDDGVDWGAVGPCRYIGNGMEVIEGVKPFVFARNCNLGILAARTDDVVLLNDDAILKTPDGFTRMQQSAQRPGIGLVSATTNHAGNPEQFRRARAGVPLTELRVLKGATPGNSFPTVAFVCVLIPRRTIDQIGLLDERFTAYGWEDNDYNRRCHEAGLSIGVHDGCYVDHGSLTSTFRGGPAIAGDIQSGRDIYMAKWGRL